MEAIELCKPATQSLNIRLRDFGTQHVYYYCDAHALMRISDCEDDESTVILSADEYDNAAPRDD